METAPLSMAPLHRLRAGWSTPNLATFFQRAYPFQSTVVIEDAGTQVVAMQNAFSSSSVTTWAWFDLMELP